MLVFLATIAFLVALAVTPLVRGIAIRVGMWDEPDYCRKEHQQPIPRLGGVAVMVAYLAALLVSHFSIDGARASRVMDSVLVIMPAAGIVFLVGLFDDVKGLTAFPKLMGQLAAALIAYTLGLRMTQIGSMPLQRWQSLVLTVGWLVFFTNAFNLIDGLDGLATGVGLSVTCTILIVAAAKGHVALLFAAAPLAGALLGFLCYNINPASIFLGDSGSLTIGFILGAFSIIWSQKATTLLGISAPLTALSLPIADVCLVMFRRWAGGASIFVGDRRHIHHRLLDFGLKPWQVSLLLHLVCFVAALFALGQALLGSQPLSVALAILFVILAALGVWALSYVEFEVLSTVLSLKEFRTRVQINAEFEKLRRRVDAAESIDEYWDIVSSTLLRMGVTRVELFTGDQKLSAGTTRINKQELFQFLIPLGDHASLELMAMSAQSIQPWLENTLVHSLRRNMVLRISKRPGLAMSSGATV